MENPWIEIKDAVIRVLKSIDPQVDVFLEEILHTGREHGFPIPDRYYFVSLIPTGNETVDRYYTDVGVLVDIAYHEKEENNTAYFRKAARLEEAFRPVFSFGGRKITVGSMSSKVTDRVLHCSFPVSFRCSREPDAEFEKMGELHVAVRGGEERIWR